MSDHIDTKNNVDAQQQPPPQQQQQAQQQQQRQQQQPVVTPSTDQPLPLKDDSRFWIALAIILGMLVVLIIAVAQAQYTSAQQLAAIFSGWITSIIAFYFLSQTNTQAQNNLSKAQDVIKTTTQQAQDQITNSAKLQAQAETKAATSATDLEKAKNKIQLARTLASQPTPPSKKAGVMGAAGTEEPETTKQLRENIIRILES